MNGKRAGVVYRRPMVSPDDTRHVVERSTSPAVLPFVPELRLRLVTEGTSLWRCTDDAATREGLAAPYWAYAWAGGQGLARYVLDHPPLVAGKRVLDFGTGTGIVGIAAMKAGAASVRATEVDALAIEAARRNAALNAVTLDFVLADVVGDPCADIDVVLAGDVFFETALAERCLRWFRTLVARGVSVLVGDPGRYYLPQDALELRARYVLPDSPAIEDEGVRKSNVFTVRAR